MLGHLSRNQLVDLESLLSSSTVRFDGTYLDPYRFVLVRLRHQNNNNNNNKQKQSLTNTSSGNINVPPSTATTTTSSNNNNNSTIETTTREVFEANWKWDSLQAATYVLWWAFRPTSCKACGSVDLWKPSADNEYVCPQCFTGAGNTNLQGDFVQDDVAEDNDSGSDFGDDGAGLDRDAAQLGDKQLLRAGAGTKNGLSSGNVYSSSSTSANIMSSTAMAQWVMDLLRKLRFLHVGITAQLETVHFPAVLRVTMNLTTLLYLPDMTNDSIEALKAACFYVACSCVIPSVVSFPSVQSVVADSASMQQILMMNASNTNTNNSEQQQQHQFQPSNIDVRWTDVLYVSNMVGVDVDDFFTGGESRQHTRNLVAVMTMEHQPSGKLYDTARSQKAQKILAEMRKRAAEVEERQGEKFSPDHTAAIFVLECGRQQPDLVREWKNTIFAAEQQQQNMNNNNNNTSDMKTNSSTTAPPPVSSSSQQQPSSTTGENTNTENDQQQQQLSTTNLSPATLILLQKASEIPLLKNNNNNTNSNSNNNNNHQGGGNNNNNTKKEKSNKKKQQQQNANSNSSSSSNDLWFLLVALAEAVRMTPAAFAEMVEKSGLYGEKIGFYETLQRRLSCGEYLLPLTRRISPCTSPWNAVFRALHSDDRLPLLAALNVLSATTDASKRYSAALSVVQQILRKHGSLMTITFNYVLHVSDPTFPSFQGLYFCTQIDRRGALYMSLTQSKSIRFMGATHQVYLNEASEKNSERLVASHIVCSTVEPITVALETQATKLLIDCVQKNQTSAFQQALHAWLDAAAKLSVCCHLRRKMNAVVAPFFLTDENMFAASTSSDQQQQQQQQQNHTNLSEAFSLFLPQVGTMMMNSTNQNNNSYFESSSASINNNNKSNPFSSGNNNHRSHNSSSSFAIPFSTPSPSMHNREKCSVLMDIKGLIANARKNPSWTTSVLSSSESLQEQVSKWFSSSNNNNNNQSGIEQYIENELIERGVLPTATIANLLNNNNSGKIQNLSTESLENINSLHSRVRSLSLSRRGDLETIVLNSTFHALLEHRSHHHHHHRQQQQNQNSHNNNSAMMTKVNSDNTTTSASTTAQHSPLLRSSGGGGNSKNNNNNNVKLNTKSSSASPILQAAAASANSSQQQQQNKPSPKISGKRRSRSGSPNNNNNKKASPKLQATVVAVNNSNNNANESATATTTTTTTTTTILPPTMPLASVNGLKSRFELFCKV